MFILARLYNRDIPSRIYLLVPLCFFGVIFIAASERGGFLELVNSVATSPATLIWGFMPAIMAVVVTSLAVCGFKCGTLLSEDNDVKQMAKKTNVTQPLDRFGAIVVFVIINTVSIPSSMAIGFTFGEPTDFIVPFQQFGIGVLFVISGGVFLASGAILWQSANARTRNIGINAIGYMTPVFSLLWLWAFAQIGEIETNYLIIGTVTIVMANLFINFEEEIRWGFKALLLALGIFGSFVYFREEIFSHFGVVDWYWTATGYFEAIALSATVFTLLLAFRVARLVTRTSDEERRTFNVFRKLELLARRGVISKTVVDSFISLDKYADSQRALRSVYGVIRMHIVSARKEVRDPTDRQILNDAEGELDTLVRSKQSGLVLGELFALVIFGASTIILALLTRPPVAAGWNRLLVDLFAMVVSGVVFFLLINVRDLHRDRKEIKLEKDKDTGDYMVQFSDVERRTADQLLSVVVGIAIVATFAVLLGYKWMG